MREGPGWLPVLPEIETSVCGWEGARSGELAAGWQCSIWQGGCRRTNTVRGGQKVENREYGHAYPHHRWDELHRALCRAAASRAGPRTDPVSSRAAVSRSAQRPLLTWRGAS